MRPAWQIEIIKPRNKKITIPKQRRVLPKSWQQHHSRHGHFFPKRLKRFEWFEATRRSRQKDCGNRPNRDAGNHVGVEMTVLVERPCRPQLVGAKRSPSLQNQCRSRLMRHNHFSIETAFLAGRVLNVPVMRSIPNSIVASAWAAPSSSCCG